MESFVGKEFAQKCGDTLLVIEKSSQKQGSQYLYKCKFLKYPYELFVRKSSVLKGTVSNPQIEQKEFVEKFWKQNCGDTLKIIKKGYTKGTWICQFLDIPCTLEAQKSHIVRGKVNNPLKEEKEFIGQKFEQNCGDILKVLSGTFLKKNNHILYKCQFEKYEAIVFATKGNILSKSVLNPQIEQKEFVEKLWLQNCGDTLKILEKTDKKENTEFLWKCIFQKYPCLIYAKKEKILNGQVENPNLPWKSKELLQNYLDKHKIENITLTNLAKLLGVSASTIGQKINEYNLRSYIDYSYSGGEDKIKSFIQKLGFEGGNSVFSDIKYLELDVYLKEKNLGIEYNGNYWHSELYKKQLEHQEKSLLFKEKGIQVIQIFEYEWENKQLILESLLKSKLGIFEKKIFARECIIKELTNYEYISFCEKNHLQGSAGAKFKIGLFYKEELVQIISFGVPRFNSAYEWEIIRECSKLNYLVVGGKSKLWNYFLKTQKPNTCLSYCDFSKFTGDSYLKLGFKFEKLNKPGFVWWDQKNNCVYWRNPYKHQEMKNKGYLKIYDCGQLTFVWKKD